MLEKLLEEVRLAGVLQPAELALKLNTSPAMIQAMLADLERMGYLKSFESCEAESCTGCSLKSACSSTKSIKILASRLPGRPEMNIRPSRL